MPASLRAPTALVAIAAVTAPARADVDNDTRSAAGASSSVTAAASPTSPTGQRAYDLVRALNRAAYPIYSPEATGSLRGLRPLNRMVGNASVVGTGEATHNSREFFTLRDRIFRSLVAKKEFTTFAHETSWSTGAEESVGAAPRTRSRPRHQVVVAEVP